MTGIKKSTSLVVAKKRRYRTGKSSKRRLIKEIRKTGLIVISAVTVLAISIFLIVKLFDFSVGGDREAATAYLNKAQQYIIEQNPRAAKVELKNAIQADQKWPEARLALASVYLDFFDAVGAKAELLHVRKMDIDSGKVDYLLGKAHWLLGEFDDAEKALTNPKIEPKDYSDAQRILGRVLIEIGDVDGSRAAFNRALGKTPDNSTLWTDIARFRYILGDQKGAIEAVEHAVELDAENIRALEFRGRMVRSQFGLLAALPWFERALEIKPDDISVMAEYAATLGDAGRATDMLAVTRDILKLDSRNGNAYFMQATIAARARDYQLARRLLLRAGDRQNNLPAGLLLSGIVEYELGNYNRAIGSFRTLLDAQPHNKTALKLLSSGLYRSGEYDAAHKIIMRYIKKYGHDSYSNAVAARALEAVDKRGEAAKFIDKAVFLQNENIELVREENDFNELEKKAREKPNRADLVIPYIRALLERGENIIALTLSKRLLEKNLGVADAHILVGDIQIRNNQSKAAIKHYNDARQISFEQPLMTRLVDAYRRVKNYDAANETLLSYLSNNPRNLAAQKLIADNYMAQGDAVQSVFWLEAIKDRIGHNDTLILTKLSRSYSALNRHDDAVKIAKIAYDINPFNADTTRVYGYVLTQQGVNAKAAVELLEKAQKLLPDDKLVAEELNAAIELQEKLLQEAENAEA